MAEFEAFLDAPAPIVETADPDLSRRIKRNAMIRAFGSPVALSPDCRVVGDAATNIHPTGITVRVVASEQPKEGQKDLLPEGRDLSFLQYRWKYVSLTLLVEILSNVQT